METTTFKTKGFWYNLYRFNYKNELPADTCTFKRGIIAVFLTAIILLPLTLMRLAYRYIIKTKFIKEKTHWTPIFGLNGYLPSFALIVVPLLFGAAFLGSDSKAAIWEFWLVGMGLVLIIITIVGLFAFLISEFLNWKDEYQYNKRQRILNSGGVPESKTAFGHLYESWKDKLCKKIDWGK